ncbi:MAG: hypothetical protein AAF772_14175, partial [Acidobacteriota bacterium]
QPTDDDPDDAQAAAYARYLYLHPKHDDAHAALVVGSGNGDGSAHDDALRDAMRAGVAPLFALWDAGAFFPRLIEPGDDKEPRRCKHCAVAPACLRGDSGARGQLRRWADKRADAAHRPPDEAISAADALARVWWLPKASPPASSDDGDAS